MYCVRMSYHSLDDRWLLPSFCFLRARSNNASVRKRCGQHIWLYYILGYGLTFLVRILHCCRLHLPLSFTSALPFRFRVHAVRGWSGRFFRPLVHALAGRLVHSQHVLVTALDPPLTVHCRYSTSFAHISIASQSAPQTTCRCSDITNMHCCSVSS